ncbi:unnamed protein product [Linum tenue]|uniref:Uncharacterized protein n=1 Tax=Linum tenue TaxID=586396 RepID=A0AAV0QQ86_9ROSI|nr:unnamed protein product [Linum tenue]
MRFSAGLMAFPLCFSSPPLSPKHHHDHELMMMMPFQKAPRRSFISSPKVITTTCQPKLSSSLCFHHQKSSSRSASAASCTYAASASTVFSLATTAVLPFYVLMLLAPKSNITRKCMGSMIPDAVLGLVYGYVVYLSWTPDTLHLMFGSKYMVPQLVGVTKMFASDMRLTSAWIHMVAVDLFAARQVYKDGLENGVETRHSVALCLLACPLGILTHLITKIFTARSPHQQPPS